MNHTNSWAYEVTVGKRRIVGNIETALVSINLSDDMSDVLITVYELGAGTVVGHLMYSPVREKEEP